MRARIVIEQADGTVVDEFLVAEGSFTWRIPDADVVGEIGTLGWAGFSFAHHMVSIGPPDWHEQLASWAADGVHVENMIENLAILGVGGPRDGKRWSRDDVRGWLDDHGESETKINEG